MSNHDEVIPNGSNVDRDKAILPAATDDLHHNVVAHFFGDNAAGIDGSSLKQNPAYEPCSTVIVSSRHFVYTMFMLTTITGSSLPTQLWYGDLSSAVQYSSVTLMSVGMRTLLALGIILIGYGVVKLIEKAVIKGLESLRTSKVLEHSPVGEYTKQPELAQQIEAIISKVVFWLLMLVVFDTAATAASFTALENLFGSILSYVPDLFVALIILIFGTLLAGFFEIIVKNSVRSFDPVAGRLMGKITSYVIMSLAVMIAVAELGIAQEYILVLFIGFVATLTISIGLAVGLGGQHLVKNLLNHWYERFQPPTKGN